MQETNNVPQSQPLIEVVRSAIHAMVIDALEQEKKKRGRRFSTYHEAYAYLNDSFQDLAGEVNTYASALSSLWDMVREGRSIETEFELEQMAMVCERVAELGVELGALTGKLMGGVVHPPKGE